MTLLHSQMKHYLASQQVDLTPHSLIKSRTPVETGKPPQFTLNATRTASGKTTASWREHAENKVVETWREAVAEVCTPQPYSADLVGARPSRLYEFPTGFSQNYSAIDRFRLPEILFNPAAHIDSASPIPPALMATPSSATSQAFADVLPLTELVYRSVMACDSDQRGPLLANVVVVGGGSFIPGLVDRLNAELSQRFTGQRIRIHAPGNAIERRYSPWLGGSILASLGTFHQLWVAKSEWDEYGAQILRQRESRSGSQGNPFIANLHLSFRSGCK